MFRKVITFVLALAVLGIFPLLSGCDKNEVKIHTESETKTVETHTVVE